MQRNKLHLVRWKGIIRAMIPALVLLSPIIIAIVYVSYSYLRGYCVSTDSLLAIVILFQTYIIWIQVEIALRQTAVFKTEYEPTFKIKVNRFINPPDFDQTIVSIQNVGKYPAYNVVIGLLDKTTRKPTGKVMEPDSKAPMILAPNDSMNIFRMSSVEFSDMEIEMNILYGTVSNEIRQATFVKFPKSNEFTLLYTPLNVRQGILLKSLEDFKLAYQAIKWRKYPRKSKDYGRTEGREN